MRTFAVLLFTYMILQLKYTFTILSEIDWDEINTKNVTIGFNPYVSILDEHDHERYREDDLIQFISKITNRFTKFYMEIPIKNILRLRPNFDGNIEQAITWTVSKLSDFDGYHNSKLLSPFAAAKYNCLNTTGPKINVILGVSRQGCECAHIVELANFAKKLTDEVNKKCSQTITTILLKYEALKYATVICNVNNCTGVERILEGYQWGSLLKPIEYCNFKTYPCQRQNGLALVAFEYSSAAEYFALRNLSNCKSYMKNPITIFINWEKISFSEIDEHQQPRMTYLVNSWRNVLRDSKSFLILSQAFDSFDVTTSISPFERVWETNGWWYLKEDPGNANTSSYIFQEKIKVASKVDQDRDPKNFQWLYKADNFSRISSGIVYTGKTPLDIVTNDFCQLIVDSSSEFERGTDTFDLVDLLHTSFNTLSSACGSEMRILIYFSEYNKPDMSYIGNLSASIPLVLLVREKHNSTVVEALKISKLKYGYNLLLKECTLVNRITTRKIFFGQSRDAESTMYVVQHFIPDNFEAIQLFRHTKVLLEQCKTLVNSHRHKSAEIGVLLVRTTKVLNFYDSPWEMQNFIKYVNLIKDWAYQQTRITVYVGPDVGFSDPEHVLGWYMYDKNYNRFVTIKELAINLSESRYMKYNSTTLAGKNTNNIVMIVCIPIAIFALLILTVAYIIRYHYKNVKVTRTEIDNFLNGDDNYDGLGKNAYIVPYDQSRYEIADGQFQIELDQELGSGEFGKVSRATVIMPNGEISVAAKTTNPHKFHSTMLNGLLSEVKLLAYIGKHSNIIELIGANTTYLREGKVYVFLELCHMGSLEKFLRDMRLLETTKPVTNTTRKVEKTLSDDLYRWSIDICDGMKYLASKHVVHADLASRNVLLNIRRQVKICDFGLSRRLYHYTTYVKSKREPLPWKWMAPEALQYMQFNEKTDVWAYGITLWEIYSLGSTPYAGLTWNVDFVQMLKSGFQPQTPEFEERDMYRVMQDCWSLLPDERPCFSHLLEMLSNRTLND